MNVYKKKMRNIFKPKIKITLTVQTLLKMKNQAKKINNF